VATHVIVATRLPAAAVAADGDASLSAVPAVPILLQLLSLLCKI
jgi:hypothetical protein